MSETYIPAGTSEDVCDRCGMWALIDLHTGLCYECAVEEDEDELF